MIKIKFVDFWEGFIENNFLYNTLKKYFPIVISSNPDFIIYSVYGNSHLNYNCTKIFYTAENVSADYKFCDYSIGFEYSENPRHLRYPLFLFYGDINSLIKKTIFTKEVFNTKTNFCSFVVSNELAKERIDFFRLLCSLKKVDSAGRVLNNMKDGWRIPDGDKYNFLKSYRFNIAFENSSSKGYTTEKIFEPLMVNSIPIYWGDPLVNQDFNEKSFVNIKKLDEVSTYIDKIMHLENDIDSYLEILNTPCLTNNVVPYHLKEDRLYEFFNRIFYQDNIQPVSKSNAYQLNKIYFLAAKQYERLIQVIKKPI